MSIDRFKNKDVILATNRAIFAKTLDARDENLLVKTTNKLLSLPPNALVELHAYTQDGLYVGGIPDLGNGASPSIQAVNASELTPTIPFNTLNLKLDVLNALRRLNLQRGTYKFTVSTYRTVAGNYDTKPFYIDIDGISPDRTEIKLVLRSDARITQTEKNNIRDYQSYKVNKQFTIDNLVINFGNNNVYKVVNLKQVNLTSFGDGYYIKLYEPLPTFITEKDQAWLAVELSDAYVDTVTIIGDSIKPSFVRLRDANFNFDVTGFQNTETTFKSWNELLAANTITAQTVVDRYFSGSITDTDLPIDYSAFDNFVFYGSAYERLANFKYKVEMLEFYDSQIGFITNSTASNSTYAINNIELNQKRKDALIGTFDNFERWLYYEPTSSLFTHDLSGSYIGSEGYALTPYPKYLYSGSYRIHHTTSSIATSWYNGFASTASFYDEQNGNALVNHIPEFLRLDERNDEFITFVNMIAQHYDTLWTYVDGFTKIRSRDEHPKLGIPKQLVHSLASQYGVELINGRQTANLWQYKLGLNSSGSYQTTGSLFSKSEEDLVTDVWRRIVLNMPYLLKTKGTSRAVKALLNTYGIPQTLVSIREYGGPALEGKQEASITEDRFAYTLTVSGSSAVKMARTYVSSSTGETRPPDTIEFRFRPAITSSMSLLANSDTAGSEVKWNLVLEHTASYVGSGLYGRLNLAISGSNVSASTPWAPLFDGEYWNVRLTTDAPITSSAATRTITIATQKASDSIKGNIVWDVSGSTTFTTDNAIVNAWASKTPGSYLFLGGVTGTTGATAAATFYGNLQGYKEYMEVINDTVYDYHTLNPASYRGNNPTSSFYTLVRYYPLGLDNKKYDHSTELIVSSSHPSKDNPDYNAGWGRNYSTDGTASGFVLGPDGDNYGSIVETYYVYGTSVAGLNVRAEKIRLEDNTLVGTLNPNTRAERSRFDTAPVDNNKLSIVFSPQEQINKDIFNNLGYININDYLADPLAEYEEEYTKLNRLSREYFKKYKNRTDINEYVRAFSLYDFSIFEMLKQFVPMRANLSTGLLIEPHVLERSKVALIKRPSVENPQWEQTITATLPTASGEYIDLATIITGSVLTVGAEFNTYEALITQSLKDYSAEHLGEYLAIVSESINPGITSDDIIGTNDYLAFLTSSTDTTAGSVYRQINLIRSGSTWITSSVSPLIYSPTGSIIDTQRKSYYWKKVIYHYSTGSINLSKREKHFNIAASASINNYYSRSLAIADYRDDDNTVLDNLWYEGCKISAPDFNVKTVQTPDGSPVIEVFETNANRIVRQESPFGTELIIE